MARGLVVLRLFPLSDERERQGGAEVVVQDVIAEPAYHRDRIQVPPLTDASEQDPLVGCDESGERPYVGTLAAVGTGRAREPYANSSSKSDSSSARTNSTLTSSSSSSPSMPRMVERTTSS